MPTLTWQLDPALIGTLLTLAVVYGLTVGPLRARLAPGEGFPVGKASLFYGALLIIFLAEGSPLHDLSERYLFSAHMVQHLLLSYVAAPLLIRGTPDWVLRPLLLNRVVRPFAKVLFNPVVAFLAFNLFFSLWHFPSIYEAALQNPWIHHLEHVFFIGTAIMLGWPLMSPLKALPRLSHLGRLVYLFLIPMAQFLVAAVLTFAHNAFYPTYIAAPRLWGLTAAADQQLGGIIMKIGGAVAFGIPFVLIFFAWYAEEMATGSRKKKRKGSPKKPYASDEVPGSSVNV